MEIEAKILGVLSGIEESIDTLALSKLVIGANGTQKMVNPSLYNLLKEGKIERILSDGISRPKWKLINH